LQVLAAAGIGATVATEGMAQSKANDASRREVSAILAENLSAANLSDERLWEIRPALERNLIQFQEIRDFEVDDRIEPAPIFASPQYTGSNDDGAQAIGAGSPRKKDADHVR